MKLVPLVILLGSLSMAKKIRKIKRLLVTIGGIASLARNGGIGKSLQVATQQVASRGLQYASNFNTLHTSAQPTNSFLITTGTSPAVISLTNGIITSTSAVNAVSPNIITKPTIIKQQTVIHRNIAVPIPVPFAVPVPKDVLVPIETPIAVPVDRPYPVHIPVLKAVDQHVPVWTHAAFFSQAPVLHHASVAVTAPLIHTAVPVW